MHTRFVEISFISICKSSQMACIGALTSTLLLTSAAVSADDDVSSLETPPPLSTEELSRSINTPNDSPLVEGETAQAEYGVTQGTADVVTEYRIQQKLYLIEVKPKIGGNYYLRDGDGDGSLDEYRQSVERDTNIGKWRLGSW